MIASCALLSSMLKKYLRHVGAAEMEERPDSLGGFVGVLRPLSPLGHFTADYAELTQRGFSLRSPGGLCASGLKHAFARWFTIPVPTMRDRSARFDRRMAR